MHGGASSGCSARTTSWSMSALDLITILAGAPRLAAARALTNEAVQRFLKGDGDPALAAMAKNTATDMCTFVCDQAVQLHGGYGYMRDFPVERLYRDARLYPLGGGTREIMNEIIAKAEGY